MAETIVASTVQWIGSLLIHEASTLFKVADQVMGLQKQLQLMQEYLQDADTNHDEGVRTLVRQIRLLAYEVEDVIDTYILKIPAREKYSRFRRYAHLLHNARDIYKLGKKIPTIKSELQRIGENLNSYGVRRITPNLQRRCWTEHPPTYPFEVNNNEYVVGLEKGVSKLIQVLMGEENTYINILSIVGMGGSGKTTIARKLFNHRYSKECYNCKAWVYISQEWSIQHILSEILRQVVGYSDRETSELHANLSREELVDKLRDTLKGKSYLVVLDDIWRREAVEEILPALPFEDANKGSKIIFTTRNRDIIQMQILHDKLFIHETQPLSEEEEAWQLFSKLALSHRTDCDIENFKGLGMLMLNNCGGLPLAIVALAGILKTRASIGEWQQMSEVVKSKVMNGVISNGCSDGLIRSFPTHESNLRSIVLLTRSSIQQSAYDSKERLDLTIVHQNFKLLRLLNLWGIQTNNGTLPEQIGSLIHLRYLGIRASNINVLPCSIGNLRNLLTLDYRNISSDKEIHVTIPNVLWKLLLLRHLFLPVEYPCTAGKLHLSTLEHLQTLWGVRYSERGDSFSRDLEELSKTVKKLKVIVSTEKDLQATFNCQSLKSGQLHTFYCEWKGGVSLRFVNPISHNKLLHKLVLVGKIEVNQLSFLLPSNLVILELRDSIMEDEDPMMAAGKLPVLKFLRLSNSYYGTTSACEITSFPMLEELYLENLPNLKTWNIQKGAMPCLKKLMINCCGELSEFPGLSFVANLQQLEFSGESEEFRHEAKECGWSKPGVRLPSNIQIIIEQSDSHIDTSSITKLYKQLTAGVFLNRKMQKFWVIMHNAIYQNCFMLYATRPTLDRSYMLPNNSMDSHFGIYTTGDFREWNKLEDSEVSSIRVVSERFHLRAEMEISFLTPGVTYEIACVIMIRQRVERRLTGFDVKCSLHTSNPSFDPHSPRRVSPKQYHKLHDKPRDEWIQLAVGEYNTSSVGTRLIIKLKFKTVGVIVKGVLIQPKLVSSEA